MSHNASGALCPFITSHTTALSTAGAGQTLTITGFGLSLATTVAIPAALGVETARSYTKASATSGTLTITMTVASIPDPATNRSIAISQAGTPCQGPNVTAGAISVYHGWIPSALNPALWWDAEDLSTFVLDGSAVTQWGDKSANGVVGEQNDAADKPSRAIQTQFSGGTANGYALAVGSGEHLDLPDLPDIVDSSNQFTHFVVMSVPGYGHYSTWYQLGDATAPVWMHRGMGDNYGGAFMHKTSPGNTTAGNRTQVGYTNYLGNDVAHLITYIGDAAAGYSTRLNGSEVHSGWGDSLVSVNSASGGLLGSSACHIAEIIHVPRLCAASEITQAEAYLNAKWGVYS